MTIEKQLVLKMRMFCFQGQILQQIKIRFCSNGVCCSWGISFRWHFWHIHFLSTCNNVIMKNKVLSYHGLNSGKSSTVADYLHFPSNKNTNTIYYKPFILRILTKSPILGTHHNHKQADNHRFCFVTPC